MREHLPEGDTLLDAELVVTELVSNALDHAEGPRSVQMSTDGRGGVEAEVSDAGGEGELTVGRSRHGSYRGRGLTLINEVSRWGIRRSGTGAAKTVWAKLGPDVPATSEVTPDLRRAEDGGVRGDAGSGPRPPARTPVSVGPAAGAPSPEDVGIEQLQSSLYLLDQGRVVVIELVGYLDLPDSAQFETFLRSATTDRPEHLVVDVSRLSFLSSGGFGALVNANYERSDIHGRLHLVGTQDNRRVSRLITISGMRPYLDLAEDRDELLLRLGCRPAELPLA